MLQRAELKRVETTYEGLMLEEIRFPKADEVDEEVEEWVEQVMRNWRVFCGPTWYDEELGEGGQEAAGRNVLDVSLPMFSYQFSGRSGFAPRLTRLPSRYSTEQP